MQKIESIVIDDGDTVSGNLRDGYSPDFHDWQHNFILLMAEDSTSNIISAFNKKYIKEIYYE